MIPEDFLHAIIDPGLARLEALGGPKPADAARVMLLAIALQESGPGLEARYQHSPAEQPGPARGFWQFEQGGGVLGVLSHRATRDLALAICDDCGVVAHRAAVWRSLEGHDDLAVAFARLLLWSDPAPLPSTEQDGWAYYLRNWRPGKPHPARWPIHWETATNTVAALPVVTSSQ